MLKTDTRTIGGLEVTTTQFAALRSLRLMTRLGAILAPMLAGVETLALGMKADLKDLAPILAEVFSNLTPDVADTLAREILCNTIVVMDGKKFELTSAAQIDMVFSGKVLAMIQSIAFAVEVNFRDFFDSLRGSNTES